jgi:hypothetical protein
MEINRVHYRQRSSNNFEENPEKDRNYKLQPKTRYTELQRGQYHKTKK